MLVRGDSNTVLCFVLSGTGLTTRCVNRTRRIIHAHVVARVSYTFDTLVAARGERCVDTLSRAWSFAEEAEATETFRYITITLDGVLGVLETRVVGWISSLTEGSTAFLILRRR
jgi:hypothetical protein